MIMLVEPNVLRNLFLVVFLIRRRHSQAHESDALLDGHLNAVQALCGVALDSLERPSSAFKYTSRRARVIDAFDHAGVEMGPAPSRRARSD